MGFPHGRQSGQREEGVSQPPSKGWAGTTEISAGPPEPLASLVDPVGKTPEGCPGAGLAEAPGVAALPPPTQPSGGDTNGPTWNPHTQAHSHLDGPYLLQETQFSQLSLKLVGGGPWEWARGVCGSSGGPTSVSGCPKGMGAGDGRPGPSPWPWLKGSSVLELG